MTFFPCPPGHQVFETLWPSRQKISKLLIFKYFNYHIQSGYPLPVPIIFWYKTCYVFINQLFRWLPNGWNALTIF